MDVKCEKCGTEYEFDDRKISEAGITVKCTHCGHLFKVVRQRVNVDERPVIQGADDPSQEAPGPRRVHWMIRDARGEVKEFKDLATLQKWIAGGRVSPTDEISKSGETWKPLSSIVELSSLFGSPAGQPARPVAPPPPPPATAGDLMESGKFRLEGPSDAGTPSPTSTPSPAIPSVSPAPGLYATGGYAALSSQAMPAIPQQYTPGMTGQQPPLQRPYHPTPTGQFHPGMTGQHLLPPGYGVPPGVHPQPFPGDPSSSTFVFEDQGPPGYARREPGAARGFAMGVLASVALAGAAYFIWDQFFEPPKPVQTGVARSRPEQPQTMEEANVLLGQARASWRRDGLMGFAEARGKAHQAGVLFKETGTASQRAAAAAWEARALTGQAEYARLQQAPFNLDEAEALLARAETLAPDLPEVILARLELERTSGRIPQARQALERARAVGVDPLDLALQAASLTLHAGGTASEVAEQLGALSTDSLDLPRGRYLLAAALRRSGDTEGARAQLTALLTTHPTHEPALALLTTLGGPRVVATPDSAAAAPSSAMASAAPSTGPSTAPSTAPSVAAAPAERPILAASRPAAPAAEPEGAPTGSFDALLKRGSQALERGQTQQARRLFEAAIQRNPRSPEGWSNLGWCDLDEGKTAPALQNFRKAIERSPRYADAMFGLAESLERAGQRAEAVSAYQAYLDAHRRGRHARIVERKLQRLR